MAEKKETVKIMVATFVDGEPVKKGATATVPRTEALTLIGMGKAVPGGKQTRKAKQEAPAEPAGE